MEKNKYLVIEDVEEAEKQGNRAGKHRRRHLFSYSDCWGQDWTFFMAANYSSDQ